MSEMSETVKNLHDWIAQWRNRPQEMKEFWGIDEVSSFHRFPRVPITNLNNENVGMDYLYHNDRSISVYPRDWMAAIDTDPVTMSHGPYDEGANTNAMEDFRQTDRFLEGLGYGIHFPFPEQIGESDGQQRETRRRTADVRQRVEHYVKIQRTFSKNNWIRLRQLLLEDESLILAFIYSQTPAELGEILEYAWNKTMDEMEAIERKEPDPFKPYKRQPIPKKRSGDVASLLKNFDGVTYDTYQRGKKKKKRVYHLARINLKRKYHQDGVRRKRFEIWRRKSYFQYLAPDLNLQNLSCPQFLASLLHYRAWSPPPAFLQIDRSVINPGIMSKVLIPSYQFPAVLMFKYLHGKEDFDRYLSYHDERNGEIMPHTGLRGIRDWLIGISQDCNTVPPLGEGILVLKRQILMHSFLSNTCLRIMGVMERGGQDGNILQDLRDKVNALNGENTEILKGLPRVSPAFANTSETSKEAEIRAETMLDQSLGTVPWQLWPQLINCQRPRDGQLFYQDQLASNHYGRSIAKFHLNMQDPESFREEFKTRQLRHFSRNLRYNPAADTTKEGQLEFIDMINPNKSKLSVEYQRSIADDILRDMIRFHILYSEATLLWKGYIDIIVELMDKDEFKSIEHMRVIGTYIPYSQYPNEIMNLILHLRWTLQVLLKMITDKGIFLCLPKLTNNFVIRCNPPKASADELLDPRFLKSKKLKYELREDVGEVDPELKEVVKILDEVLINTDARTFIGVGKCLAKLMELIDKSDNVRKCFSSDVYELLLFTKNIADVLDHLNVHQGIQLEEAAELGILGDDNRKALAMFLQRFENVRLEEIVRSETLAEIYELVGISDREFTSYTVGLESVQSTLTRFWYDIVCHVFHDMVRESMDKGKVLWHGVFYQLWRMGSGNFFLPVEEGNMAVHPFWEDEWFTMPPLPIYWGHNNTDELLEMLRIQIPDEPTSAALRGYISKLLGSLQQDAVSGFNAKGKQRADGPYPDEFMDWNSDTSADEAEETEVVVHPSSTEPTVTGLAETIIKLVSGLNVLSGTQDSLEEPGPDVRLQPQQPTPVPNVSGDGDGPSSSSQQATESDNKGVDERIKNFILAFANQRPTPKPNRPSGGGPAMPKVGANGLPILKQGVWDTFETIFGHQNSGSVRWSEIRTAMTSVGFRIRGCGGSIYEFTRLPNCPLPAFSLSPGGSRTTDKLTFHAFHDAKTSAFHARREYGDKLSHKGIDIAEISKHFDRPV
jgi:hypothetical protein